MAEPLECREVSSHPGSRQLGAGAYIGRVARSAAPLHCHVCTIVHLTGHQLPDHAHDWPFLSTLLRGSYVSRTRTSEMEFRPGVAVYHPRDFQHRDEIGREGGFFFGVQFDPKLLREAEGSHSESWSDIAIVRDDETYVVLGALYSALSSGAGEFVLEALSAELVGALSGARVVRQGAVPAWVERTEERLRLERHVSLEELARDAGVHKTTLTRLFRRHKNCSVGEFYARARTRRAFFAVVGSDVRLSDISQTAGYADQSHMTRDFVRAFAASPGQLRRSARAA